eukprot:394361_1
MAQEKLSTNQGHLAFDAFKEFWSKVAVYCVQVTDEKEIVALWNQINSNTDWISMSAMSVTALFDVWFKGELGLERVPASTSEHIGDITATNTVSSFLPTFERKTTLIPHLREKEKDICNLSSIQQLLATEHNNISEHIAYLNSNAIDTKSKRKVLAQRLSHRIHHQIFIKYILSKYYQEIQRFITGSVTKQMTPLQLAVAFIYFAAGYMVESDIVWEFVDHFRTYCKDLAYGGHKLLIHMLSPDTNIQNLHIDICNVYFFGPNKSDPDKWERLKPTMQPLKRWIYELKNVLNANWLHISSAINHELYESLSSKIEKRVQTDFFKSKAETNLDYIFNALSQLKEQSKVDANEINYIKQLMKRANNIEKHAYNNESDFLSKKELNQDIDDDLCGLNAMMLYDIYNVHKCFLFANYHFQSFTTNQFIKCIQNSLNVSGRNKLFMSKVKEFIKRIQTVNLYPEYIIDDDMYHIWKYFFAASRLVHTIKHHHSNINDFTLKIVVIP